MVATASEAKLQKESRTMSINAYRSLLRQRRAACLLYQSEPLLLMVPRLEAEIESQQLCMRPDKCPHADVGIKQDILESLVHSYHPSWLRLGLEVWVSTVWYVCRVCGICVCGVCACDMCVMCAFVCDMYVLHARVLCLVCMWCVVYMSVCVCVLWVWCVVCVCVHHMVYSGYQYMQLLRHNVFQEKQ